MEKNLHAMATITERLTTINIHAAYAKSSLTEVKHATFGGFVSEEELATINAAIDLMERIKGRTGLWDAKDRYDAHMKENV